MRRKLALLLLLSTACCTRGQRAERHAGDANGSARIEALPALDVDDDELTKDMRVALELSKESLELTLPAFVHHADARRRWTDAALKRWLHDKRRGAEAASQALDTAAIQSSRQRIVAAAVSGLVFERAGRDLLEVPPPADLQLPLPAIAVFREVMAENASVCLQRARLSYAACAKSAQGLKSLAHWSPFCATRAKSLPEPLGPVSVP
jgi:hypothetical protein